jgi:hypothetical protein
MNTLHEIRGILSAHREELGREFGVKSLGVFGSVARGEARPGSDVDILVEYSGNMGLMEFMRLEQRLSVILGVKVDLVTRGALKPYIGKRILEEVQYV